MSEEVDEIIWKNTYPRETVSLKAKRLERETCAECGRRLGGELRVRRPDGQTQCLRTECMKCFGCGETLTEGDIKYTSNLGRNPMYCADCHRRARVDEGADDE